MHYRDKGTALILIRKGTLFKVNLLLTSSCFGKVVVTFGLAVCVLIMIDATTIRLTVEQRSAVASDVDSNASGQDLGASEALAKKPEMSQITAEADKQRIELVSNIREC